MNINPKAIGIAIAAFVIIGIILVLSIMSSRAFEAKCESKGGHVDTDLTYVTGPVYDPNLKKTIIKTTTITSTECVNADGLEIHI